MEEQTKQSNDATGLSVPQQDTTFEEEETSPPQGTSADPLTQIADALNKLLVAQSPREIDVSPYDGTFEAQSFFDNFDAQADRAKLTYTDRLRKLPCYLQDQRLIATVQPNTIKEWFDLVSRIRRTQCATSAVYQRQVDKAPHPTYHNPPPRHNNQRSSRVTVNNGSNRTEQAKSTAPDHAQPLYQNLVPDPRSNLGALFPKSKLQAETTLQAPRAAQRDKRRNRARQVSDAHPSAQSDGVARNLQAPTVADSVGSYRDAVMNRRRVFEWYKRFKEGREETADNERSGRPSTSTTPEKVDMVLELVRED
ncbi:GVQW3 [Cordylochernes scorpioides]|uniref:GVQW3 n=1 Tax=Cordylochernes scorpioides TaxID=51811 RepID=A0ABY6L0U8_9ARAC|nr:GVQW3 [Cordylochernes scorpioides]